MNTAYDDVIASSDADRGALFVETAADGLTNVFAENRDVDVLGKTVDEAEGTSRAMSRP
jgi:hypothetical protein